MRLDKFLALQGLGTRSEVRALLRAGRVFVHGQPARDAGQNVDVDAVQITLDGEPLHHTHALHIMLNKPAGILTAARDSRRETVMDLLPPRFAVLGCMPVGRLDMDTEGLLLLTTDGQLAHRLLSPKRHVDKVYAVTVDVPLEQADVRAFAEGIPLKDFTAMPAEMIILENPQEARVTVREGKYHQVKRMFLARGKTVTHLKRLAFGGIVLDTALAPGAWRELTPEEHGRLINATQGGPKDG